MTFDFTHAVAVPFRMQPGLRKLAAGSPQLTPTAPGSAHLLAKRQVLQTDWAHALLCAPGFDATPALTALAAHAAREHPRAWAVAANGDWHAPALGLRVGPDGDCHGDALLSALPAPWRRAALLALAFEEDFAIVDGAGATLPWLAVCLPSHWRPTDKIGRHFSEIHAPVADNALLQAAGPRLFKLVCGPDTWERFVWNVSRYRTLDAHPDRVHAPPWPADAPAHAWWRTERQTFIPLPHLQQAVFTIRVQTQPLADALATPAQAQRLHDAIASMSPAVLAYRSLAAPRNALLAWLAERAAAA
ncbi:MAG: DUF3445 domain-containing protein [Proteobacteria bacterium]|nr:DUF3445 domain-containing protein [Pseudomonadota bacterium]